MGKRKKKIYAVARGHEPGIYMEWYGENGAEVQVKGFPDARYQGFFTLSEAQQWLKEFRQKGQAAAVTPRTPKPAVTKKSKKAGTKSHHKKIDARRELKEGKVIIYTDGGCINNPGPGGYGTVLLYGDQRKELSGGYRLTTNNRMELMACIEGLKALKRPCSVTLFSDSQYVVNGIKKGWAKRWKKNRWMRSINKSAENVDLWKQLLELCEQHEVDFSWVKGHAGIKENERCDKLATRAAENKKKLARDTAYETGQTTVAGPALLFPRED